MSQNFDSLKAKVAKLSVPERAELAHYLLGSLEAEEQATEEAWRTELERRLAEIKSGKVSGKPVEEVITRLRERYP